MIGNRIAEMEEQHDKNTMTARAIGDFSDLVSRPPPEIFVALAERQEKLLETQLGKARLERDKASLLKKVARSLEFLIKRFHMQCYLT